MAGAGKIAGHGRRLLPVQDAMATRRAVNPLSYVWVIVRALPVVTDSFKGGQEGFTNFSLGLIGNP